MYMKACQKYIAELLDEYGPLLQRQLRLMANAKFEVAEPNINTYIGQLYRFGDFERKDIPGDTLILPKGVPPDFDMIRSFEVLTSFVPNVISHNKANGHISIRFFVDANEHNKEICVIPVKQGNERIASAFAGDKFGNSKCEVVIFLLDSKAQMKLIKADCNFKFAKIEKQGAVFFKR